MRKKATTKIEREWQRGKDKQTNKESQWKNCYESVLTATAVIEMPESCVLPLAHEKPPRVRNWAFPIRSSL
jgi:hypothetical protein